jgi:hypothetical protein
MDDENENHSFDNSQGMPAFLALLETVLVNQAERFISNLVRKLKGDAVLRDIRLGLPSFHSNRMPLPVFT